MISDGAVDSDRNLITATRFSHGDAAVLRQVLVAGESMVGW